MLRVVLTGAVVLLATAHTAFAGRIVLANDEWQTSNFGFTQTNVGSTAFALNVASFFTGGGAGSFLVVSDNNLSLDTDGATSFASTLTGAGHTLTDSEDVGGFMFDLATLQTYDAVFLALPPTVDQHVLVAYVNAGGNVYINGGTGIGGPASEAANWNTFLNTFGLNFVSPYNGLKGNVTINSSHQIMTGVPSLYQDNGNTITLVGGNPNAQIIASSANGLGLYAVYDDVAAVPEPASILLLLTGITGLAAGRRRARVRG